MTSTPLRAASSMARCSAREKPTPPNERLMMSAPRVRCVPHTPHEGQRTGGAVRRRDGDGQDAHAGRLRPAATWAMVAATCVP